MVYDKYNWSFPGAITPNEAPSTTAAEKKDPDDWFVDTIEDMPPLSKSMLLTSAQLKETYEGFGVTSKPSISLDAKPIVLSAYQKFLQQALEDLSSGTQLDKVSELEAKVSPLKLIQPLGADVTGSDEHSFRWYLLIADMSAFYALEYMVVMAWKRLAESHGDAEIVWAQRVSNMKAVHDRDLAALLSDYLALITFGEARWSKRFCACRIEMISGEWNKKESYRMALNFNPDEYLPKLIHLFGLPWSVGDYGGERWKQIAEAAWAYRSGEWPPSVFIDMCFDIEHNTRSCLDKPVLLDMNYAQRLRAGLAEKERKPFCKWRFPIYPDRVMDIIGEGQVMGILPEMIGRPSLEGGYYDIARESEIGTACPSVFSKGYVPLVFGNRSVGAIMDAKGVVRGQWKIVLTPLFRV